MLDGFALCDLNTAVIRALHSPAVACAAPAAERKDLPEPSHWGVVIGTTSSSSTGVLLTAGPAAWTGDIPLVPSGAVSDELAVWIRLTATPQPGGVAQGR